MIINIELSIGYLSAVSKAYISRHVHILIPLYILLFYETYGLKTDVTTEVTMKF